DLAGGAFTELGRARVEARADGVLSGVTPFLEAARLVDPDLEVAFALDSGERFGASYTLATLAGRRSNFLARLSGVATLTARYVAETAGSAAVIAATRKTTPGLRALEKQAVVDGGGSPHRFGLFDGPMIKDNHVAAAGGLTQAVAAVRASLSHPH